ncbi:MAG: thiamine diphosphokinase [Bacillota bacterium]|nr:thiamine diphosphokinase [Bacillota bacterium]
MTATWVVLAGGDLAAPSLIRQLVREGASLLCADTGVDHARALGLVPQVLVGDWDSASPQSLQWAKDRGAEIHTHPVVKDASDLELAFQFLLQKHGLEDRHGTLSKKEAAPSLELHVFGATGARLDQTMASLLLLPLMEEKGVTVHLHAPGWLIRALGPFRPRLTLPARPGALLSLVPLDPYCRGVTLEGTRYPLQEAVLSRSSTLATSNEVKESSVSVTLREGILLLFLEERDPSSPKEA